MLAYIDQNKKQVRETQSKVENFKSYISCYNNCYICQGEGHNKLGLTKLAAELMGKTRKVSKLDIKMCLRNL